jgi:hypothetical protein
VYEYDDNRKKLELPHNPIVTTDYDRIESTGSNSSIRRSAEFTFSQFKGLKECNNHKNSEKVLSEQPFFSNRDNIGTASKREHRVRHDNSLSDSIQPYKAKSGIEVYKPKVEKVDVKNEIERLRSIALDKQSIRMKLEKEQNQIVNESKREVNKLENILTELNSKSGLLDKINKQKVNDVNFSFKHELDALKHDHNKAITKYAKEHMVEKYQDRIKQTGPILDDLKSETNQVELMCESRMQGTQLWL